MRHPLPLLAVLTLCAVVACGEPKPDAVAEDLTRLCAGLTELEARHVSDGFEHSRAMQDVLTGAVHETATREFMATLATRASSAERMAALQAFAADHGLPNYQCPVLLQ